MTVGHKTYIKKFKTVCIRESTSIGKTNAKIGQAIKNNKIEALRLKTIQLRITKTILCIELLP